MARESREIWCKRVERWAESGLSAREFAAELGVNAARLANWKYRLEAAARKAATKPPLTEGVQFVEVKTTAPDLEALRTVTPPRFELVLTCGATVRIPEGFDATTLRRLLDVMTVRC